MPDLKRIKEIFQKMDPEKQQKVSKGILILVIIFVGLAGYYYRQSGNKQPAANKQEEKSFSELQPNPNLLEKSLYYETKNRVDVMGRKLSQLDLELKKLNGQVKKKKGTGQNKEIQAIWREIEKMERGKGTFPGAPSAGEPPMGLAGNSTNGTSNSAWPPPPLPSSSLPPQGSGKANAPAKSNQFIGGIGKAEQTSMSRIPVSQASGKGPSGKQEKPGKERSVYLPPSFMSADLISGFDAPTMEAAKSEPVRVLLRIKDLAVLPNDVKGDLQGCFMIAEGFGNLADERAHLRLLRLSCIARDGTSVIDAPIKGFVVDSDGRIGLRGKVVAKMGSYLARTAAAGFLQGFGSAYSESGTVISASGIGTTSTMNPDEAFRSGVGQGISKGANQIGKFYMEMARQTFPVIEIGAGKRVTVVIDKGMNLNIRRKCLGGRDGCTKCQHSDGLFALRKF